MKNYWLEGKFSHFSKRELMILKWWSENTNFHDLSTDFIPYSEQEQKENQLFIEDSDKFGRQLDDEIFNRFSPCFSGRHKWSNGLLDHSKCETCNVTVEEISDCLPCSITTN